MDYEKHLVSRWNMASINPPDLGWRRLGNNGTGTGLVASTDIVEGIGGGSAVEFNGANEYIWAGDVVALNSASAFTFATWFRMTTIGSTDGIMSKGNGISEIAVWAVGTQILFSIDNGANYTGYLNNYDTLIAAGEWHHLVEVFDGSLSGSAERLKVFLDGDQKALTFTGAIPSATADMSGRNLTLGRYEGPPSYYWEGALADVRVYDAPLTQAQIRDLYISSRQGRKR